MDIDDLYKDMIVKVIVYDDFRPEHWSPEVVTISGVNHDTEEIYIYEDDGAWQWFPWDFEPYHMLKRDDPNSIFKRFQREEMMKRLREELFERKKS